MMHSATGVHGLVALGVLKTHRKCKLGRHDTDPESMTKDPLSDNEDEDFGPIAHNLQSLTTEPLTKLKTKIHLHQLVLQSQSATWQSPTHLYSNATRNTV
jgi:hypothetical protein